MTSRLAGASLALLAQGQVHHSGKVDRQKLPSAHQLAVHTN